MCKANGNMSEKLPPAHRIVLVGAAGHGLVVADAVLACGAFDLVGFIDEDSSRAANLGIAPIIGGNRDLPRLIDELGINAVVVAIGDNWVRKAGTEKIKGLVPHPDADAGG
jgi:FlaA1/EpsC-like NDP-sugar epimerase